MARLRFSLNQFKGISLLVLRKEVTKQEGIQNLVLGFPVFMVHFPQAHTGYEIKDMQQGKCHKLVMIIYTDRSGIIKILKWCMKKGTK